MIIITVFIHRCWTRFPTAKIVLRVSKGLSKKQKFKKSLQEAIFYQLKETVCNSNGSLVIGIFRISSYENWEDFTNIKHYVEFARQTDLLENKWFCYKVHNGFNFCKRNFINTVCKFVLNLFVFYTSLE